jgi:hypothetical protein
LILLPLSIAVRAGSHIFGRAELREVQKEAPSSCANIADVSNELGYMTWKAPGNMALPRSQKAQHSIRTLNKKLTKVQTGKSTFT